MSHSPIRDVGKTTSVATNGYLYTRIDTDFSNFGNVSAYLEITSQTPTKIEGGEVMNGSIHFSVPARFTIDSRSIRTTGCTMDCMCMGSIHTMDSRGRLGLPDIRRLAL